MQQISFGPSIRRALRPKGTWHQLKGGLFSVLKNARTTYKITHHYIKQWSCKDAVIDSLLIFASISISAKCISAKCELTNMRIAIGFASGRLSLVSWGLWGFWCTARYELKERLLSVARTISRTNKVRNKTCQYIWTYQVAKIRAWFRWSCSCQVVRYFTTCRKYKMC